MGEIRTFRDLVVWRKAMALVTEIYRHTKSFPKDETYGLISQIRRSAVSIPSNIAEGFGRHATNDYVRFLRISMGSLFELETQIEISRNLGYLNKAEFEILDSSCREIERMISSLIRKIRNKGVKQEQRRRGTISKRDKGTEEQRHRVKNKDWIITLPL